MISETDLVVNSIWVAQGFDTRYILTEVNHGSHWACLTRLERSQIALGYDMIVAGLGSTADGIAFPLIKKLETVLNELPAPWYYVKKETIRLPFSVFYNEDFVKVR